MPKTVGNDGENGASAVARRASLILILGVTAVLITLKTLAQIEVGPLWDTYAYAANAASIAGQSIGYAEPWRSPMLSVLTAPVMAAAGRWLGAIQVVDALLALLGVLGIFQLLRRRLAVPLAAAGALLFPLLPPVWTWLGVGYTDIAAVVISTWAMLFLAKAVEENPWWYVAALPALVAAAMTRFTALLLFFPFFIYLFLRWRPFRQAKVLALGASAAVATYAPAGIYYATRFGDALFPFIIAFGIVQEQAANPVGATGEPGSWPAWVLVAVGIVAWFAVLGFASRLPEWWRRSAPKTFTKWLLAAVGVAIAAFAQTSAGLVGRQVALAAGVFLVFAAIAPVERDETGITRTSAAAALDAAMLAWLLAFADQYWHHPLKVPRYTIAFVVPATYFLLLGLQAWLPRLRRNVTSALSTRPKTSAVVRGAATAVLVVPLLALAGSLAFSGVRSLPSETDEPTQAAVTTARWLAEHATDLDADPPVFSDVWPYTSWYVGREALPMPSFEDTYAVTHELAKTNAAYYVTWSDQEIPGYREVYQAGGLRVIKREAGIRDDLPRILYLGDSWQNYVEPMCGYEFYLDFDSGAQGWEGTVYLDALLETDLEDYPAIAAYGFRWRDRAAAENTLSQYLEDGGTFIVDVSGNLSAPAFSLADTAFFDTVVRREELPRNAVVEVTPEMLRTAPTLPDTISTEWLSEDGSAWFGADYKPLRPAGDRTVLATVAGRPLVVEQRVGEGRVLWVAYNLVWHAFVTENPQEMALVRAVFRRAISQPESGDTEIREDSGG